ncbi:MAG: ABC transporter permease [Sarcina sp.]
MKGRKGFNILLLFSIILTLVFFITPIISMIIKSKFDFIEVLKNPIVIEAILTSLKSTCISILIIIVFGIPVAYVMARKDFKGKSFLEIIIELPMVLPPSVAGLLLLITFGRNGVIGKWLYEIGIQIPFTFIAVLIAQIFVAMPIFIRTVRVGVESIDEDLERTAELLGDSKSQVFFKVIIPLAKNSIIAGAILSWARALGEFGATIMFAGNITGKTQTLPLAIYIAMENDIYVALAIAAILIIICVVVLMSVKVLSKKGSVTNA